uniref:Protein ENHANCED DISEASE RESISTANCE 2 C-terminal domain-containing protein n=1 Tax=Oryza rufipogon TaxID=4529 RepID=A0A0E0Q254_ORYRU
MSPRREQAEEQQQQGWREEAVSGASLRQGRQWVGLAAGGFVPPAREGVPGRPDAYSAVFYFAAEAAIPAESLLGRFVHGDDAYRNARFKIVNRIVKGPWLVRATVGNYAACLLGRALTCRYHGGDGYLEIDVDIGSSAIASAILHLALGAVTSVTIDMGFLVESQSEEELPERLFGAVRIAQMEMGAAKYVETAPDDVVPDAGRAGAGFRVHSAKVANDSRHQERAAGKVGRSMSCQERGSGGGGK